MTRTVVGGTVIIATGVDLVSVPRFEALLQRRPGIVGRLFEPVESHTTSGSRRSAASLAARFAAKEAVAKALGAPSGLHWHDCQVMADDSGRPHLLVVGSVAEAARARGIEHWHLSLSHDGDYAIAQVIAEGGIPGSRS